MSESLIQAGRHLELVLELFDSLESKLPRGENSGLEQNRASLAGTIRNYLLPRIENESGPIRVVFAGPTGSGKSTLLNSIVGNDVSRSGSVRPTTTRPLAYVREDHASRFRDDQLGYEVVEAEAPILSRVTLIDTPDIDSTNMANHHIAQRVLATADIIVFVASALRYADLVPWQLLRQAQDRGIPVIHVLNRISTSSTGAANDMRRLLRSESMRGPLVRVEEHHLSDERLVPTAGVRSLKRSVLALVQSHDEESDHVLEASITDLALRSAQFFDDLAGQLEVNSRLRDSIKDHLVDDPAAEISSPTSDWLEMLKVTKSKGNPTVRWLRRHGLSARSTNQIGTMACAEISGLLEQRLRLFDFAHGGLVVNLTASDERSPAIYEVLDRGVARWYLSLESGTGDVDVDAYLRAVAATRALAAVRPSQIDEGPAAANSLHELLERLAEDIAEMVLPAADDEPARLAVESALSILDRLVGAPALADA